MMLLVLIFLLFIVEIQSLSLKRLSYLQLSSSKRISYLQLSSKDINNVNINDILEDKSFISTILSMAIISAPLGTMLDNQHGLFHVLEYDQNYGYPMNLIINDITFIKSAIWVPLLFGIAGLLMSSIALVGDKIYNSNNKTIDPSYPKVFYGISMFSFQYWMSGLLDINNIDNSIIHSTMFALMLIGIYIFDTSTTGIILAILTGIGGPLIEILLINTTHLYKYTNADFFGIDSWICWIYALGAPAVANLARRLKKDMQ